MLFVVIFVKLDRNKSIIFNIIEIKLDDLIWQHRVTADKIAKETGLSFKINFFVRLYIYNLSVYKRLEKLFFLSGFFE